MVLRERITRGDFVGTRKRKGEKEKGAERARKKFKAGKRGMRDRPRNLQKLAGEEI